MTWYEKELLPCLSEPHLIMGTSINSKNYEFGVTKALLNQHFKF
ncbi:hypothetical protein [Streptococcus suis]